MEPNVEEMLLRKAVDRRILTSNDAYKARFQLKAGQSLVAVLRNNKVAEDKVRDLLADVGVEIEAAVAFTPEFASTVATLVEITAHRVLPLRLEGDTTVFASDDPTSARTRAFVSDGGRAARVSYASPEAIDHALAASTPMSAAARALMTTQSLERSTVDDLVRRHPRAYVEAAIRELGLDEHAVLAALAPELGTVHVSAPRGDSALLAKSDAHRLEAIGIQTDHGPALATFRPERLDEVQAAAPGGATALISAQAHAALLGELYPTPAAPQAAAPLRRTRALVEVLVEKNILTREQAALPGAEDIARADMDELSWAMALQEATTKPFVDPEVTRPDERAADLLPQQIIRQHQVFPLLVTEQGALIVLMADPRNLPVLRTLTTAAKRSVIPAIATPSAIQRLIQVRLERTNSLQQLNQELEKKATPVVEREAKSTPVDDVNDNAIVKMMDQIISEGIANEASDIHIEPTADALLVRYRIDGELEEHMRLPRDASRRIIARLKVMTGMDIAENRVPQDNRLKFKGRKGDMEFRVSVMPVKPGGDDSEKAVLRMLNKGTVPRLTELGLSDHNAEALAHCIAQPYGILLVTGPTGSGKTTTCNSVLTKIATPNRNTVTIEDPVEYEIAGINQTQVNTKAGMSFAKALRAFLRQDPDIIFVGEIRDSETAKTAMEAALTGHLVIATLHTNDAPGAIIRLEEMAVERFHITGSLIGVVAQRLVRKLCPDCRVQGTPDPSAAVNINLEPGEPAWLPSGKRADGTRCPTCRGRGYRKRMGIHEVMVMNDPLRQAVTSGASANSIRECAMEHGLIPMRQDGLQKARDGETSIYEVLDKTRTE